MKINYHDLYNQQFERVVIAICQEIFGIGVQSFSTGPDGGRDARFNGTASNFPNSKNPISGKIIIQAKHTEGIAEKFSNSSFSSDTATSILSKEIERMKKIKALNDIDHYMLFSNRRLSGDINTTMEQRISKETKIKSAYILGIEYLDLLVKKHPQIYSIANINDFEKPLRVNPNDLAEVIIAFSKNKDKFATVKNAETKIERKKFQKKNEDNNLSSEYAENIRKYMPSFKGIKDFFGRTENAKLLRFYLDTAEEFKLQIIAHKKDYACFDNILNRLFTLLIDRDYDLRKNKKLTRTILFYMYWNCDIGTEKNA